MTKKPAKKRPATTEATFANITNCKFSGLIFLGKKVFVNTITVANKILLNGKDRVASPKRMNFWKRGEGQFQSKNLCCRFWIFKQGFFRKNCNMIF